MGLGYLASSFDLLNVGHLDVIAQARARCEQLVVGVFSDELVAALTGRPPVVPLVERMALVSHVRGVGQAVVHDPAQPVGPGFDAAFSMAGEGPEGPFEALVPARTTSSPTLLAALRPTGAEAVA